ncbi:hypothetical protein N8D56_19730 [Devosia sp. A8/3-2]|nr:hypothetical protein N8D56_19730 [Devosia sp. A8/3-2]
MELKEFVKQAVQDIIAGLNEASDGLIGLQAVGHSNHNKMSVLPPNILQDHNGGIYSVVNFDVAVTTLDEVSGGGRISIVPFKMEGKAVGRAETISRIQFATIVRAK